MLDHDARSYDLIARVFAGASEGLTPDDILDNVTLYWLTNTAVSSARLYWESKLRVLRAEGRDAADRGQRLPRRDLRGAAQLGDAGVPEPDPLQPAREGGHFAAWEQPELFSTRSEPRSGRCDDPRARGCLQGAETNAIPAERPSTREEMLMSSSTSTGRTVTMPDATTVNMWERLWRMNGVNVVLFFVAAYLVYGPQPKIGASANELVSFYDGDRTRILIAAVIFGLAVLNLMWFAAAIRTTLVKPAKAVGGRRRRPPALRSAASSSC